MTDGSQCPPAAALAGIRVLDMSRVLAGPWCGQILADLGAEVIKIERPGSGDDTRGWGPPYLKDREGHDTHESAYFLGANRGKKSVTLDIATPAGQEIARRLAAQSDVLIENYKAGDLTRYNLGYEQLRTLNPGLVYCSITGFGQTGPMRSVAGYDFIIQAMGGLMSVTGEADGRAGRRASASRCSGRRSLDGYVRDGRDPRRAVSSHAQRARVSTSTWRCSTRRSR